MQLVERHIIKKVHKFWSEIDQLCFASKNLYNLANYNVRLGFIQGGIISNYNLLDKVLKNTTEYRSLPAKVSQQTLRNLDQNWKSFLAAIKEWSRQKDKFSGRPSLPNYKPKSGRHLAIYTAQAVSIPLLRKGIIKLSGTDISIPTSVKEEQLAQVRIVPMSCCYVIEVVYEKQESAPLKDSADKIAALDLGLNNLAALTSNQPSFQPILINGRPLKSINQFFNKRRAALQKQLRGKKSKSGRLTRLTHSRNQKVNDYLHKASNLIVKELLKAGIDTLVIGQNSDWKRDCNLGKRNNQNFVSIPHGKLIKMLTYKGNLGGIKVFITEESYTSKASFLDLDFLPVYGQKTANTSFSGKRICRGLYRNQSGQIINADVNASYNILRKAFPEAFSYGIESCVVQPRLVTPTKVKTKGEAVMSPKTM